MNAETGGGLTAEERFWAAAQRHGLIPVTAPWQFLPARDKDALRKALDEYDAARLADRDAALARAREAIRVEMLAQPMTDGRDTYGDGYQQGLARAIDRIDAALVPVPGPGAKS